MTRLLPCPFCGNDPRHLEHKGGFYTERIICDTCYFYLPPDLWNRRAALGAASEPAFWFYRVNGVHEEFSETRPPDDAYDEGTLVPPYTHPSGTAIEERLPDERISEIAEQAVNRMDRAMNIDRAADVQWAIVTAISESSGFREGIEKAAQRLRVLLGETVSVDGRVAITNAIDELCALKGE